MSRSSTVSRTSRASGRTSASSGERSTKWRPVKRRRRVDLHTAQRSGSESNLSEMELGSHQLPWTELAAFLDVDLDLRDLGESKGLTQEEADDRLKKNGPNLLKPPKKRPEWLKYILCYCNFFMLLLFISGLLCFIIYAIDTTQTLNLYFGAIYFFVIMFTSTVDYVQSRSSSNVMKNILKMVPHKSIVRRDGVAHEIDPAEIVVGDIVVLKAGDRVPADCRVLFSKELKVDNSSLTGESEPVLLSEEATSDEILNSKNVCFASTLVTNGEGICIVFTVADRCMVGVIASMAASDKGLATPLQKDIRRFVRLNFATSIGIAVVFLLLGYFVSSFTINAAITNALGLLTANVPQGLPLTVSISLAVAAKRLRKANVVIKDLYQVETLGSVSVIATDKTGTLTLNRMTASHMWLPGVESEATDIDVTQSASVSEQLSSESSSAVTTASRSGSTHVYFGGRVDGRLPSTFLPLKNSDGKVSDATRQVLTKSSHGERMMRAMTLCSRATFESSVSASDEEAVEQVRVVGDATEAGFLRFSQKVSDIAELRTTTRKIYEIPFNSENKFQLSIHEGMKGSLKEDPEGVDRVLLFKGAPEIVLDRCDYYFETENGVVVKKEVDDDFKKRMSEAYQSLGGVGERVLGYAQFLCDSDSGFASISADDLDLDDETIPLDGFTFIGLASLIDPPKEGVPEAVALCRKAGVKIIMMTGDHPLTAEAIARQVGIFTGETREQMAAQRGVDTKEISEEEVNTEVVLGNTLPELTEDQWDSILSKKEVVFARMSPLHKVLIVQNCQRRQEIVAVTGDGVNDAPALKKANVGVAMGIAGSEVSKDAADIILLDDDFSSIVLAIKEGRVIYENLKKCIVYILTHLTTELWPFLWNIMVGIPVGISAISILLIDLGTEIVPGVALAYEKGEQNIMNRPPRKIKSNKLVNSKGMAYAYLQLGTIQSATGMFVYYMVMRNNGISMSDCFRNASNTTLFTPDIIAQVQTAYFICIVVQQTFTLYALRTRSVSIFQHKFYSNPMVFAGWIASLIICVFVVHCYGFNTGVGLTIVPFWYWCLGLPGGVAVLCYTEFTKLMTKLKCIPVKYVQF